MRLASAIVSRSSSAAELAARGSRDRLDLGDHRLRQIVDGQHHAGAALEQVAVKGGIGVRRDLAQVVAGREGAVAGGLDDHASDLPVLREAVEFRLQRVYKVARQGIHGARPVEREDRHLTFVAAQQDRFVWSG